MAGTGRYSDRRGNRAATATAIGFFIAGTSALAIDTPAKAHNAAQAYDESGSQLLHGDALTRHMKTGGVTGKHTLDTALHELLAGTGLTYKVDAGRQSVSIVLAQAATQTQTDASGAHPLPPIEVQAAQLRAATSAPAQSEQPREISQPTGVAAVVDDVAVQRATTSDTASLLRDVPGAAVFSAGGVSGMPVLDGLADDRLHVSVSGIPIIAACANHMNPPLSYIDPSHVGKISVYTGVVPVSAGGDSIGGAILVEPPPPVFAAPGQMLLTKGEAGAFFRSNGSGIGGHLSATAATENFSITYNGSVSQSHNYRAAANFHPFGPAFLTPPSPFPITRLGNLTPWLAGNEVASTDYQAQNHDISLAFRHENHLVTADVAFQHIPYQNYPNQRMDMTENRSIQGNVRYNGEFDWGKLDGQVYHQTVRHIMDFGEDKQYYYGALNTVLAPGMPMDTKAENTGAKLTSSINVGDKHILRLGGEFQIYRYWEWWPPSPAVLPKGKTMGGMAPDTFININDGQRDRFDLFGEVESRWNSQWTTLVGVRSDVVVMNSGPVHGYNSMMYDSKPFYPATTFNNADRGFTDPNWNATALTTYTPSPTQTYSLGYSMKTRSPNLYERYAWSTSTMAMEMIGWFGDGNYYIGNLGLQPETAHTASFTADWHSVDDSLGVKFTPYFTYISNYIDARRCPPWVCGTSLSNLTTTNNFVALQFINQNARLFGGDLAAHAVLAKDTPYGDFIAKGTLAYVNGQNTVTGYNLYQMMPVNSKLSLEQKWGGWTNAIEGQFVGAKSNVDQVRNEVKTGGYALFNLRTSYEWNNVRIDLGIENLFNTFYYLPLGGAYVGYRGTMSGGLPNGVPWGIAVPGMGRSFYVATNVKF
jgi:iron complex outermembrane recepter protein